MAIINANIRLSILISIVFLEKRNHAPISAKIIKIDTKPNDVERSVVVCSETESVRGSMDDRKGFAAFIYLNPGVGTIFDAKIETRDSIIPPRIIEEFLICLDGSLNLRIESHITKRIVEKIRIIPA